MEKRNNIKRNTKKTKKVVVIENSCCTCGSWK